MKSARRAIERGVTLVEVLIVTAVIAIVTGAALWGPSAFTSVRLQRASVMIASAVRVAIGHANATSNTVRLVFDFDERSIALEESTQQMLLKKNDPAGGAAAATQAEQQAMDEIDKILKGPVAPRPQFKIAKAYGFDPDGGKKSKVIGPADIRFLQIETQHDDLPVNTRRAYLYVWPGGATERAAIQIGVVGSKTTDTSLIPDADIRTILVQPLTGKTELRRGRAAMIRPRDDVEDSERQDGF